MYFDPGTGSMIIQMLLGALPVIAAFFVGFWKKIFKKSDNTSDTPAETVNTDAEKNNSFEEIDDE